MDPALVALVLIALVAAAFAVTFVSTRRRAPQESGLVPMHEELCSGRAGWFVGATYPWIRVSLYDGFFVVAYGFMGRHVCPYTDIVRAELQRVFFSWRVVIETKSGLVFRLSVKDYNHVLRLLTRT